MGSVDVVVPCYNYAKYLRQCVQSILSQRDTNVRVLILDDASPDNTPEVAGQLAASDRRVTYVRNKTNLGLIGTANKGVMEWASADYVVLLSADDALTPGSLARSACLLDTNPDIGLAYGMALMLHDEGSELVVDDVKDAASRIIPGHEFLQLTCAYGNFVPAATAVMRTAVQHRIGGYNPKFKHTSDLDMWMRTAAVGSIGFIDAVQGFYRWHQANMSAAYYRQPADDRLQVVATCTDFMEKHQDDIPQYGEWFEEMRSRFGNDLLLHASKAFERDGDRTWRNSIEVAQRLWPDYWRSPIWWKFVAKRILGQRSARLLKSFRDSYGLSVKAKGSGEWTDHGNIVGRWFGTK
jgi:glycosyltransferase involved in cell wall biosynthesis